MFLWFQVLHLHTPATTRCTHHHCAPHPTPQHSLSRATALRRPLIPAASESPSSVDGASGTCRQSVPPSQNTSVPLHSCCYRNEHTCATKMWVRTAEEQDITSDRINQPGWPAAGTLCSLIPLCGPSVHHSEGENYFCQEEKIPARILRRIYFSK